MGRAASRRAIWAAVRARPVVRRPVGPRPRLWAAVGRVAAGWVAAGRASGCRAACRLVAGALAGGLLVAAAACSRSEPVASRLPTSVATTTTPVGPGPRPTESVVTGPVTPTPTATPLRITGDQMAQVLITPGDLPAGYQVDPYVSPDTPVSLPPGCPVLDTFGTALTAAPVRAARGFAGGEVVPLLEERVAVLPGRGPDLMAQLARVGSACRTFDSRDADGVVVRFTVAPLALTAPGVEVIGLSLAGRPVRAGVRRGLVVTQAVALRRGDVVVLFVHSGLDRLDVAVLQAGLDRAAQTLDRF